jgi:hypothetical protein
MSELKPELKSVTKSHVEADKSSTGHGVVLRMTPRLDSQMHESKEQKTPQCRHSAFGTSKWRFSLWRMRIEGRATAPKTVKSPKEKKRVLDATPTVLRVSLAHRCIGRGLRRTCEWQQNTYSHRPKM